MLVHPAVRSDRVSASARSPCAGTGSCTSSASCCSGGSGAARIAAAARPAWHRARTSTTCCSTAMLGMILGGRLGYVLFYKPGYYLAASARDLLRVGRRHVVSTAACSACSSRCGCSRARRKQRWLDVTDFVAPLVPLGLAAGPARQLHQRGAVGPADRRAVGDGVSATSTACRGIRRSSTSSRSRASLLFADPVVVLVASRARAARCPACSCRLRRLPLHRRVHARARQLPRLSRARPDDGPVAVAADDRCGDCAF